MKRSVHFYRNLVDQSELLLAENGDTARKEGIKMIVERVEEHNSIN
jgi:hypothetical protein